VPRLPAPPGSFLVASLPFHPPPSYQPVPFFSFPVRWVLFPVLGPLVALWHKWNSLPPLAPTTWDWVQDGRHGRGLPHYSPFTHCLFLHTLTYYKQEHVCGCSCYLPPRLFIARMARFSDRHVLPTCHPRSPGVVALAYSWRRSTCRGIGRKHRHHDAATAAFWMTRRQLFCSACAVM